MADNSQEAPSSEDVKPTITAAALGDNDDEKELDELPLRANKLRKQKQAKQLREEIRTLENELSQENENTTQKGAAVGEDDNEKILTELRLKAKKLREQKEEKQLREEIESLEKELGQENRRTTRNVDSPRFGNTITDSRLTGDFAGSYNKDSVTYNATQGKK